MTGTRSGARARELRAFRALLRIKLWTAFRPMLDSSTGTVRMRPMRALVLSYTLMGVLFAGSARAFADLRSYAIMFFASVLAIGIFSLVPDLEQQRRAFELLNSKPIRTRTMVLARGAHILLVMTMMVACLATPPLFYASDHFGAPLAVLSLLFFALLLAVFTAALAWSVVQLILLTQLPAGRLRAASQVLLTMVVVAFSSASIILRITHRVHAPKIALDAEAWRFFPPAWFVDFVLGDLALETQLERGAALALLATSLAMFAWMSRPAHHAKVMEQILEPANLVGRMSLGVRALDLLKRSELLRRTILPPSTCGVAALILNHAPREQLIFARLVPLRMLLIAAFLSDVFLLRSDTPMTGVLGAMLLVDGVRLITQSPVRGADWVLRAAPLSAERVLDGIRVAAWIGFFAFPLLLTTASVLIHRSPPAAAVASLAYALEGHIMISLATGIDPAWPLSREQRLPIFFGYLIGWPIIGALQGLRHVFIEERGRAVIYLVLLLGLALAAKAWSIRRFASSAEA